MGEYDGGEEWERSKARRVLDHHDYPGPAGSGGPGGNRMPPPHMMPGGYGGPPPGFMPPNFRMPGGPPGGMQGGYGPPPHGGMHPDDHQPPMPNRYSSNIFD